MLSRIRDFYTLLYVPLGIIIIQGLFDGIFIASNYIFSPKNALIPDYLLHYSSFPRFILLGIYIVIGLFSYYLLRTKTKSKPLVIMLLILSIALVLSKSRIILFFHTFNPYG